MAINTLIKSIRNQFDTLKQRKSKNTAIYGKCIDLDFRSTFDKGQTSGKTSIANHLQKSHYIDRLNLRRHLIHTCSSLDLMNKHKVVTAYR